MTTFDPTTHFASTYTEARAKFGDAARARGLPADVDSLTFRDLQARRQTILRRMQDRERPRRRRGSDAS